MYEVVTQPTVSEEESPRISEFRRFTRVFFGRKVVLFGLIIIVITILVALLAPILAPYDPYTSDLDSVLLGSDSQHLLGTDALGRDTLSRLVYGSRTSLIVGIAAIILGAAVGMTLGLLAGFFGGVTYLVIMRFIDALQSFPMILLALVIAALMGGGLRNIVIALGVGLMSTYARLMCGQVLSVKENEYVMAGRAIGASNWRIILNHVLPNCFPPLIVLITLMLGSTILAEASLSFLGVGVKPPEAAWGGMVSDGYRYLRSSPLLSFCPGIAIMLVVFSFNMVGDGLRDALDPRLRGTL